MREFQVPGSKLQVQIQNLKSEIQNRITRYGRYLVLILATLLPRLLLLRIYDVELSQDGFEAVRTLTLLQSHGIGAVPRDLIDRFILHPLYMLVLYALRLLTPPSIDFYFAARLLSTLFACIAVVLLFELVRRAYGEFAAWVAALLLAFASSFLWESVAILSSTLFLALYLGVLLALYESRFRLAATLAFLSALTRYEGAVLIALVLIALAVRDWSLRRSAPHLHCPSILDLGIQDTERSAVQVSRRDWRGRHWHRSDWAFCIGMALAVPLVILGAGWLGTGSVTEFLGAQSMASIWLRFLAPGDFIKRGAFFITQYPALLPLPVVLLGIAGGVLALVRNRQRATVLLFAVSALYLLFFEALVWFNYTTLEVRFLMYPGLPLLVFASIALASIQTLIKTILSRTTERSLPAACCLLPAAYRFLPTACCLLLAAALLVQSYRQADAGMRFVYNMMASQREMAEELARLIPPHRVTNLLAYTGTSGALDYYGQAHGLEFTYTDFRFAPDDDPEQFVLDRKIDYVIYPVGNAFAKAKYPYLAQFDTQSRGGVTFQPLVQFATSTDNQLYSIWAVWAPSRGDSTAK